MWLLLQDSTSIFNSWVTQALLVVVSRPVASCQALDEVRAWCFVYSDTTRWPVGLVSVRPYHEEIPGMSSDPSQREW